jgi:hypothetical protein
MKGVANREQRKAYDGYARRPGTPPNGAASLVFVKRSTADCVVPL